jgi:hypothetical protein
MSRDIPEPTGDQCTKRERVYEANGEVGYATFGFPQMGGYCGKAVVVFAQGGDAMEGCFDVYLWHDGEFPYEGKPPVETHYCDPKQFAQFAREVMLQRGAKVDVNRHGYLVTLSGELRAQDTHPRTYACADRAGLDHLIQRLTGRKASTFALDERGIPSVPDMTIAYPLHIYGGA